MRIVIIGYGSLVWDLENLAPFVTGDWQSGCGPKMPVEFSRISPKRQQALALVIDEALEHQCKTSIIESSRTVIKQAIIDLANRERCETDMIGLASMQGDAHRPLKCVFEWLHESPYDTVLWTALPGNFQLRTGQAFSHENGRDYLKTLPPEALKQAWQYIEFAPQITDTPFRRYLRHDAFWQSLDYGQVP